MIKTAILGLGKVAERIHLPACAMVPELNVVAASDASGTRLAEMGSKFGIKNLYSDSFELLAKEQPELVIIGTPPDQHKSLSIAALHNGADVLCEKPFVLSLQEADEVLEEARKTNRILAVNTQYRHMNTYREVHDRVAARTHGRLFFVQVWQQMFHPPAFEGNSWRAALKQSTLYEFGSHPLDLICYMFDSLPESVTCHTPRVRSEYESDVLVQMTLRFPGERLATLALNRVSNAPERYLEMRLDADQASFRISLGGVARASFEMARFLGKNVPSARLSIVRGGEARLESNGTSTTIAVERNSAFASATARHLRSMLNARSAGTNLLASAEHAREILRIIFAGYKSAETGETVRLSEFGAATSASTAR